MITVWGRRNSVNVQKVLWALEELDVPYTRENVGGSFGDMVMGAILWRYTGLDVERPETPNVTRWFDTVQRREAFRHAVMAVPRARSLVEWNRIERESA